MSGGVLQAKHEPHIATCVTVLSLLEMHSGRNVRRPRCRPFSPGVLGASDLILIYYWGGLRSAAPTGGQRTGVRVTKRLGG